MMIHYGIMKVSSLLEKVKSQEYKVYTTMRKYFLLSPKNYKFEKFNIENDFFF